MTFILILTCFFTPVNIAFNFAEENLSSLVINYLIDLFYFIDIFVIFNTARYDYLDELIDDRKLIALEYFKGWFTVDFLSIIPFDLIFD